MSSANNEFYFFPSVNSFYFFFISDCCARTSKIMLDSGESGHSCLVPDFRGNAFSFFAIKNNVWCGFVIYGFYYVEVCSFYAYFLESLFFLTINGCLILSKAFSTSIEIIIWFLSFNLLIWCTTLIDLQILKNLCTPGIKPIWS